MKAILVDNCSEVNVIFDSVITTCDLVNSTAMGIQVTDSGLGHLKGLSSLEFLDLRDTQVTPEGVQKLQEALPECQIEY